MTLSRSDRTVSLSLAAIIVFLTGIYKPSSAQEQLPADVITMNTNLVVFDAQVFDKKTKRAIEGLTVVLTCPPLLSSSRLGVLPR